MHSSAHALAPHDLLMTQVWLRAFFAWTHELRLFRLPTRVFVECFVALVTAPDQCALYDLIPPDYRCMPQTFTCHAWDDELHAVLSSNLEATWLSLFAVNMHARDREQVFNLIAPPRISPHLPSAVLGLLSSRRGRCMHSRALQQLVSRIPACIAACGAGLVVCLPAKGEPEDALRPLRRSWCLLEMARCVTAQAFSRLLPPCAALCRLVPPSPALSCPHPTSRSSLLYMLSAIAAAAAEERSTDPYAAPRPPAVRFAFGGVDDDVERHRAISEALRSLKFEASTASGAEEASMIKGILRETHGAEAEVSLRQVARRAFWMYYCRPQHAYIRALYEL